jgi:Zn-dependent protease with chaperone function
VPSFQLLEPRSIDEGMGIMPPALGICALLLIACGCFRVIAAQTTTSRVVARWLEGAHPLNVDAADQADTQTVTFRSRRETPPLTLVGVSKPRVLVSESTVALLSHDELHIALKHELAHMQSRDNLKKLAFRFCPFPGMAKLESAWSQTAELAADDAAVSNLDDAVDLAAALVKLSRLVPVEAAPVCTVGFVTGSISARVARLLAWDEAGKAQPMRIRAWCVIPPVVVVLLCVFVTYGPALALTHEVTEWLVR